MVKKIALIGCSRRNVRQAIDLILLGINEQDQSHAVFICQRGFSGLTSFNFDFHELIASRHTKGHQNVLMKLFFFFMIFSISRGMIDGPSVFV